MSSYEITSNEPSRRALQPSRDVIEMLLYIDRIGPLLKDADELPSPGLRSFLEETETPLGTLYVLGPQARKLLGYKNPWKRVGARHLLRRFATRRLVESLVAETPLRFLNRYRGSLLLSGGANNLILVAGYFQRPSKPTIWGLYTKGKELGARIVVAYDRPQGGGQFNLVREGAIEYRRLKDLPEHPGVTLELIKARP